MMRISLWTIALVCWVGAGQAQMALKGEQQEVPMQFMAPLDGAQYVNINTQLLLRPGGVLNIDALNANASGLSIVGSISGSHSYTSKITADGKTLLIRPTTDFELNEWVTVEVAAGMLASDGNALPSFDYGFQTSQLPPHNRRPKDVLSDEDLFLPRNWIDPTVIVEPQPGLYEGNIFINTTANSKHLAILDMNGSVPPLWDMEALLIGNDFKVNRNGKLTFFDRLPTWWLVMDEFAVIVDTIFMTNGYLCYNHDFQMTPDEHAYMFAYDDQIVDMSQYVPGGDTEALVEGFVIQELDENEDLVFEWRSWDWFQVTDNQELDLTDSDLNLFHINSVEVDTDNNLFFSCRHTSEVTKINHTTGQIIWRMGDNDQNEFTFVGSQPFSYQHDARRLANGNILLFDNANLTTQLSRAVEFNVDPENGTATKVWEYVHPENLFGASMGGCNRLPNGNTSIYWGNVGLDEYGARYTEVDSLNNVVLELAWPSGVNSYRVPKHDWFFDESIIGCSDPNASNYNPDLPIQSLEGCVYDDLDNDGYTVEQGDCDDNDPDINPGEVEIPYDGIDQDCTGADLTDVDGDGFSPEDGDCNDNDSSINPDAEEIPYDGIDQDCVDGDLVDVDGDGFSPDDGDCNDNDAGINPDAEEIPNDGIDQDCVDGDLIVTVDNSRRHSPNVFGINRRMLCNGPRHSVE
ncbi:MAG: aryl-sulfate sulfotransferase [Flavobacteriales bacterium]|nr:aryl-sulfate sulfotransferase [Flavobacteriales bacterium]